jgi:hypothetical protein
MNQVHSVIVITVVTVMDAASTRTAIVTVTTEDHIGTAVVDIDRARPSSFVLHRVPSVVVVEAVECVALRVVQEV